MIGWNDAADLIMHSGKRSLINSSWVGAVSTDDGNTVIARE